MRPDTLNVTHPARQATDFSTDNFWMAANAKVHKIRVK